MAISFIDAWETVGPIESAEIRAGRVSLTRKETLSGHQSRNPLLWRQLLLLGLSSSICPSLFASLYACAVFRCQLRSCASAYPSAFPSPIPLSFPFSRPFFASCAAFTLCCLLFVLVAFFSCRFRLGYLHSTTVYRRHRFSSVTRRSQ